MSSATCGKGALAFRSQKKSLEFRSYARGFATGSPSSATSTVILFKCIFKTSWTSDWYVQEWESIGIRSILRSRIMRTGLDEGRYVADDGLALPEENKLSLELRT